MSGIPLSYHIVSCSSKDVDLIEEYISSTQSLTEGNDVCWFTKSNYSFPQSLILKLEDTALVGSIEIIAHPFYLPSSMTISFGIPDNKFRNSSGKSYNASYTIKSQFSFVEDGVAREKKTIYFNEQTLFIRFTVHGFLDSVDNLGRQIGLLSVVVRGFGGTNSSYSGEFDYLSRLALYSERYRGSSSGETLRPSPILVEMDSESDDEEVLFTRDMVKRLDQKTRELQISIRPDSSMSDSGLSSSSTISSRTAKADKLPEKTTKRPESTLKSETEVNPQSKPISPRTKERVLREIEEFGREFVVENKEAKQNKNRPKRYYFGKRMAEFNNTIRILEDRREQSIWKEEYALANEIDVTLKKMRSREDPLKELLVERMDALEKNDLLEAQRLKTRFVENMQDALEMPGLQQFLTQKEMERLRIEASTTKEV